MIFWRTGRRITALVAGRLSVVVVHRDTTEDCRIRVKGELQNTEVGTARLQAAAVRVADAPESFDLQKAQETKSRTVREYR